MSFLTFFKRLFGGSKSNNKNIETKEETTTKIKRVDEETVVNNISEYMRDILETYVEDNEFCRKFIKHYARKSWCSFNCASVLFVLYLFEHADTFATDALLSAQQIADITGISKPCVTYSIRTLEKREYVKRIANSRIRILKVENLYKTFNRLSKYSNAY